MSHTVGAECSQQAAVTQVSRDCLLFPVGMQGPWGMQLPAGRFQEHLSLIEMQNENTETPGVA